MHLVRALEQTQEIFYFRIVNKSVTNTYLFAVTLITSLINYTVTLLPSLISDIICSVISDSIQYYHFVYL